MWSSIQGVWAISTDRVPFRYLIIDYYEGQPVIYEYWESHGKPDLSEYLFAVALFKETEVIYNISCKRYYNEVGGAYDMYTELLDISDIFYSPRTINRYYDERPFTFEYVGSSL